MIYVTKPYLPDLQEYVKQLERIWASGQLTNQGELLTELESKLESYLGVKHLLLVGNGTIALQLALSALKLKKGSEIITTPFSYVATTNAIIWEGYAPIFADISSKHLALNPELVAEKITPNTSAIMPVHVYGNVGELEAFEQLSKQYQLPIIYDAAHAFGVKYKGESILNYGTISTLSFHATKLFHTIEGGAIVTDDTELYEQLKLLRAFGHFRDDYQCAGINGKMSEFHAAMGIVHLSKMDELLEKRAVQDRKYRSAFAKARLDQLPFEFNQNEVVKNHAYFPILLKSESDLLKVIEALKASEIIPRRYFWPSLNTLPFIVNKQQCPVGEDISSRVLCLPFHAFLEDAIIEKVVAVIKSVLE